MAKINFGGEVENVVLREEFPVEKAKEVLKDEVIAIIGYGVQGPAQALNMRDQGFRVIIGQAPEFKQDWDKAVRDGFVPGETLFPVEEAVSKGTIVQYLVSDAAQRTLWPRIKPCLKKGDALYFSHGFSIVYKEQTAVIPPDFVDVIMVAPKGPGHLLRKTYVEESGVPCLIAVHQDASGKAKDKALAYAKGVGGTRAGVIETSFAEETETDLFGEQVVLCGGLTALIKAGFETLVEAGYQPEMAYFECLHETKLIVDLIYEAGITGMRYSVSDTAEYGDLTRGPRIITEETRKEMRKILKEIQTGEFAREWILENQANRPVFNALRRKDAVSQLEKVGKMLRGMMPFIKKKGAALGEVKELG